MKRTTIITGLLTLLLGITAPARDNPLSGVHEERPTFKLVDIDGDKEKEIIYGSREGCVHVLKKKNGKYEQIWESVLMKAPLIGVAIKDVDKDLELEIVAATEKGMLYVYGTENFGKKWDNYQEELGMLQGLLVDDIDSDGTCEIMVYNADTIRVFEGGSYFREWESFKDVGGAKIVLGNVDASAGKELVTNTGYIMGPVFYRVKWKWEPDFGSNIWLIDLDSDGMDEVVGERLPGQLTIYDLDIRRARIR